MQVSVKKWAECKPEQIALITSKKSFSWNALEQAVSDKAACLRSQGVQKDEVVSLVSRNAPDMVLLYLALLHIGAVPALISPQPMAQIEQKLKEVQSSRIWWGRKSRNGFSYAENCAANRLSEVDLSSEAALAVTVKESNSSSGIVSLVFTSGTTGSPKAVAHTSEQHIASAQGLLAKIEFSDSDCWLLSLPLYHVSGLAIIWRWLYSGAKLKIGDGSDLYADLEGATHASLVATQLKRLLDNGKPLSLKRVLLGGSHIPVELAQRANQRGIETWLGYGMTEAASTVTAKRVDGKEGVGYPLPKRQLKLEGQHILIGGNTLAEGYYRQGEIIPLTRDGWFNTKDLGVLDGDELKILGRADNLFISGGENIHCEEIEAVLNRHPNVAQVMVVPVADEEFGARPVAAVLPEGDFSTGVMPYYLNGKLDKFKWPVDYVILPESIIDPNSIKLSRKKVKAWFEAHQSSYVIC